MRHDDFDALDIERAYDNLDKEREEAAALRARVAELEAALQEQTRLRLAEIDLHEEAESAAAATARAEMQERCAKACESFAEITRTPEGAIGAIGAYACAIIIRSLSPTPEPPHA